MSATSKIIDLILDHINLALPAYVGAIMWDEESAPFTDKDADIIAIRMQGKANDTLDIRMSTCEIHLFSKVNSSLVDANTLYTDATTAFAYCMTNYAPIGDIYITQPVTDVTGPYRTKQNRYRFVFTINTMA